MEGFTDRRYSDALFLNSPIGIAYVSTDGQFVEANDNLCDFLEYSESELQQLSFGDVTHPMDIKADLEMVQECIRGERDSYAMRKRYIPKHSPGYKWAQLKVFVIRNPDQTVNHFISWIIPLDTTVIYERSKSNGERLTLSVRNFNELVTKYKRWILGIGAVIGGIITAWDTIKETLIKVGDFLAN